MGVWFLHPRFPDKGSHCYFLPATGLVANSNMSKIRGKHANCSVVDCKDQHKSLHRPPASEDRRAEWLNFIFNGRVPATVSKHLYVCANHFLSDYFTNIGLYREGLAEKLFLKEGSTPTVRSKTAER